ncbi:MAG: dihydropyrimidinase [Anaerolineae bacterium]|nr:dihydropyrimidinase [Anaerolineae bacterium]
MSRTIIRGGTLVTGGDALRADLLIEGEAITGILTDAAPGPGDRVIDASGMLVLPGIVDAHTHIQLDTGLYRTADNWEVGTRAAAAGGVTTVIDFANQIVGKPYQDALGSRLAETAPSLIDYTFHMVVLDAPRDLGALQRDLQSIRDLGMNSIKLFTTYRPNYYLDDAALLRVFKALPEDMIAMIHCENDSIVSEATQTLVDSGKTGWCYHAEGRPREAEIEAANRVLTLAAMNPSAASVYVAHCSSALTVLDIQRLREREHGGVVYCETCPQYLLLDDAVYLGEQAEHYILQPPLRGESDRELLRVLVEEGAIDVLSTDTCDYTLMQKQASRDFTKTPGGLPGVETLLPLMYTLFCDELGMPVEELIPLMTANPAQIFGLYPRKGGLQIGSDADVVLYDPEPERVIRHTGLHYLAGYSPYEGMRVKGEVVMTLSRGEAIYNRGQFPAQAGRGRYIEAVS